MLGNRAGTLALTKALHLFGYALYLAFNTAARLFPLQLVFVAGRGMGLLVWAVFWNRRRLAVLNLKMALGKSEAESRFLARRHFMNLGANLLSALKLATMSDAQIRRRVTVSIAPEIPAASDRKGWVAMLSHMGNWELLGRLSPLFPQYRFGAIYQRLANDYVDRHFKESRARSGVTLFDRREGYWKAVTFLQEGGALGVLTDQYAGMPGTWMPFFRRLTSTSALAAALAQRTGVDILPVVIRTTGIARWHVSVGHPIERSTDAEVLTARINRELERQITASPEDWLWSHNRWKTPRWGFLLSGSNRRIYFPPGFDRATLIPYRILIRSVDDPAEAAVALPAVRAIKNGRPDAEVTIVAPEDLLAFWKTSGAVDALIPVVPGESAGRVAKKIKQAGYFDVCILLPPTRRAAAEAFLAGVPYRLGPPRRFLLNYWENPPGEGDPPAQGEARYRRIAEAAGAKV